MSKQTIKCVECGKFIAYDKLPESKHHFVPLNEFGPEESEFTGPCCCKKNK